MLGRTVAHRVNRAEMLLAANADTTASTDRTATIPPLAKEALASFAH